MTPPWLPAYVELRWRIEAAIAKRRGLGLPHCGDALPDMRKLAAIQGEVAEVALAMHEETRDRVRDELFDVAVAALLSASSTDTELLQPMVGEQVVVPLDGRTMDRLIDFLSDRAGHPPNTDAIGLARWDMKAALQSIAGMPHLRERLAAQNARMRDLDLPED